MTKLNIIGLAGMVVGAVALAPAVMAQSIILETTSYSSSFNGATAGEFDAEVSGAASFAPPISLINYGSATRSSTGFETFCVEASVDFTPGTTYSLGLSLNALGSLNPPSPIPLSVGAAYLYQQFALGTLAHYDYSPANRLTDAGLLQAALWYFEGGQSYSGFPSGITGNQYYTDALNYVEGLGYGATELTNSVTSEGEFGVEIMNLTATSGGGAAQNQLVYLGGGSGLTDDNPPVPDGGATLALLGVSLAGVAVFYRRYGGARRNR